MTLLKRFIRLITFVDLPIRKKFLLFSVGVLFWFVAMYAISIAVTTRVGIHNDVILSDFLPLERNAQDIEVKLHNLSIITSELAGGPEGRTLSQTINLSKVEMAQARSLVSELAYRVQDARSGGLAAGFSFAAAKGPREIEIDVNNLQATFAELDKKFDAVTGLVSSILSGNLANDKGLIKATVEYRELLATTIAVANNLSTKTTDLYAANLNNIRDLLRLSLYAFSAILFIATVLLVGFSITITRSFANPVNSIIEQIRLLGQGKVNLSSKIPVQSGDEIGLLTENINGLMAELQQLVSFKKVIEEDDTLEDVYLRLGKAFENLGMNQFIIYEVTNDKKIRPVYPVLTNDDDIFCNPEILSNCSLCKVQKTGHMISSADYPEICKQFRSELDRVHVCIPMTIAGSTGGVVQFLFDRSYSAANGEHAAMFKAEQYIKESLSVLEAKRHMNTLRESALKDPLTGLYNRRFLQECTEKLIAGVLRRKKTIGLVMCDLDHFKQVNDTYGHNVGDQILIQTAAVIKNSIRTSDLVIRFGGEEFLILLLDVNENDTLTIAEKIREALQATKMQVTDGAVTKTMSLGVSEFPSDTEKLWQAIKFADIALYQAKETGRNRVVRFTSDMWTEQTL